MDLQVISFKPIKFRFRDRIYQLFKPYYLMPEDKLKLIRPIVKGSTLMWNISGTQLSYFQLKQKIYDSKNPKRLQVGQRYSR